MVLVASRMTAKNEYGESHWHMETHPVIRAYTNAIKSRGGGR